VGGGVFFLSFVRHFCGHYVWVELARAAASF
jgi:hypothetical protein